MCPGSSKVLNLASATLDASPTYIHRTQSLSFPSFETTFNPGYNYLFSCSGSGSDAFWLHSRVLLEAMKFFSQSYSYDDSWSIVTLAFFLRYPNPYAAHVISCDVISRAHTPSGSLVTTRLILKKGAMPRWFPKGIISRAESWVIEESEVDPYGKTVKCVTKNLDHVKIMQVEESVQFAQTPEGKTLQHTEARVVSKFGWGLTKRIENHGLTKFKANMQRSREGVSLILSLIRQSRLQPMTLGIENSQEASPIIEVPRESVTNENNGNPTLWSKVKRFFHPPRQ